MHPSTLKFTFSFLIFLSLIACDIPQNDSKMLDLADCGQVDEAQCQATTNGSSSVKKFNYTAETLANKRYPGTAFENNGLYIYAPAVELVRLPVIALGKVSISIPAEYNEIQTRHKKWKKCGLLGLEHCRKWVDDERDFLNASVEVWIGNKQIISTAYSLQLLNSGEWSEDWNTLPTILGPFHALGEGDPFGIASSMLSTIVNGRDLHKAWRSFSATMPLMISKEIGTTQEPTELRVILRRNVNNGSFLIRPFEIEIVQY